MNSSTWPPPRSIVLPPFTSSVCAFAPGFRYRLSQAKRQVSKERQRLAGPRTPSMDMKGRCG